MTSNAASAEQLRGMLRVSDMPIDLVEHPEGGYELHVADQRLVTARGNVRVFKTLDAAHRYSAQHLFTARPTRGSKADGCLVLRVLIRKGDLFN